MQRLHKNQTKKQLVEPRSTFAMSSSNAQFTSQLLISIVGYIFDKEV